MMRVPDVRRGTAAVLIAVLTVLGAAAGTAIELAKGAQWQAKSTVLVQWTPADVLSLLLNGSATPVTAEDLSDVAGTIDTPAVLATVASTLDDGSSADDLGQRLSAEPVAASHLITITATAGTRAQAERLADLAAKALAAKQQDEVDAATSDLPGGAGATQNEVELRAQLIGSRVDPIQLMGTGLATQTSPSSSVPVALALVGLAAGALVVIGLSLRRAPLGSVSEPPSVAARRRGRVRFITARPGPTRRGRSAA